MSDQLAGTPTRRSNSSTGAFTPSGSLAPDTTYTATVSGAPPQLWRDDEQHVLTRTQGLTSRVMRIEGRRTWTDRGSSRPLMWTIAPS